MSKQDNTAVWVIVIVLVVLLFGGFGMMGFGGWGFWHMGYGSQSLCANIGGIWCYWPNFGFIFMALFWVVIILLVIWLIRQLQQPARSGNRRRR